MTESTSKLTLDQITELSTLDLLDLEMEAIPEAPGYINPPTGIYSVELKISQSTYEKKVYKDGVDTGAREDDFRFNVNCQIVDNLDVKDTDLRDGEELPKAQDRFSVSFFGKTGLQNMANLMGKVGKTLQVKTARELLEVLSKDSIPAIVAVERTFRKNKDTGESFANTNLKDIIPNVE